MHAILQNILAENKFFPLNFIRQQLSAEHFIIVNGLLLLIFCFILEITAASNPAGGDADLSCGEVWVQLYCILASSKHNRPPLLPAGVALECCAVSSCIDLTCTSDDRWKITGETGLSSSGREFKTIRQTETAREKMHQSKATNPKDTKSKMKQKSKVNNKLEAEGLKQGLA